MPFRHDYKEINAIVTGGAGFIGSHIARRLLDEGNKVTVLDDLSTGSTENIPSGADFVEMDLRQETQFQNLQNIKCDVVFHLAAQSSGALSFKNPRDDLRSHIMSTFNMLTWCKRKNIKRLLARV